MPTPESVPYEGISRDRRASFEAGGALPKSPAMMDMFGDVGGAGFDISSFSFDVGGMAELFQTVGAGMEGTVDTMGWASSMV